MQLLIRRPQRRPRDLRTNADVRGRTQSLEAGRIPRACALSRGMTRQRWSRNAWMAALTDAARDAGTSGVGNCRQIASVRFSDSQASRQ